ncbi:uncharacterized protein [Nicotiana tomentosiformis]|uniref:uncharacterized protein n=1 Tax=Nicotiana tomentosiformis TaxID=4098 RepID=UPI00388C9067
MGSLAYTLVGERPLALDVQALANRFVRLDVSKSSRVLACVVAQASLLEHIEARQFNDPHLLIGDDGVMQLQSRICVLNTDGLRELILEEAHSFRYSIHPGDTKMYCGLKQHYQWQKMKKDIVGHVSWCLNYQEVKYDHQKSGGRDWRYQSGSGAHHY